MNPASGSVPVGAAGGAAFSAAPPMPPMPPAPPLGAAGGYPGAGATEALVTCPICQTPQTGRYCEECGYDYDLAATAPPQHPAPGGYGYPPVGGPVPPAQPQHQQQGYGYPPAEQSTHQPYPAAGNGYPDNGYPERGYAENGYPDNGYPENGGYPATGYPDHGYQQLPEQQAPPQQQQQHQQPPMEYPTSFALTPPAQQQPMEQTRTTWVAVVAADREYFTDMMARSGPEASGLFFPPYCPERRIPITGRGQLRIGRRSQHKGTVPEIDLSVPPEDPGASHQHALLAEQPDGSWVLVDQDSTNGTTLNGGADPITPHTAIPLGEGDRIHIGAWTTITLIRA
ncbi:FHA domain-containing protein [Kitasatospora sp. NBC_01266]|uniref:FHA domain-containing protein n=1 Tax=Kitasatospora sp. NBC_01266 TaxID=2903572 RepID=UPI002E338132|nr:FHA domain-containing protein [Kitasatospora sp. NBC_01266]